MKEETDDDPMEEDLDYEGTLSAILRAQGQGVFECVPRFTNSSAGVREVLISLNRGGTVAKVVNA